MLSRSSLAPTAGALLATVLAAPALGGVQAPEFLMTWDVSSDGIGPNTYNWDPKHGGHGTLNPFGDYNVPQNEETWTGWNYTGELFGPSGAWQLQWNCVFYDGSSAGASGTSAFVVANIVVTNFSANTENFTLLMNNPLARAIASPVERGSIVGTVTDLTGDDATVSAPTGGHIYTSLIDTVDDNFLMSDPFSETAGGPNLSNTVGPADFGIPNLIPASQDADNSIGIFLDFDLSGGDAASFTAIFEIQVPAPAALPVVAMFGLMGGRRRRRT